MTLSSGNLDKEGKTAGCSSNGGCDTGGCNKLNVFNWLSNMELPAGQPPFNIVEVRFKGSRKDFFRNKENIELKMGDVVAVEASPGHDVGVVSLVGELVRLQLKKKSLVETSDQIQVLYRKARPADIEKWIEVRDLEDKVLHRSREIIQSLKLQMKLSDVEYQGDGKKATFYYTADERVDFRELIKKLAEEFKTRIEMRQIGMRQEAGRLGGVGSCGRELCCATWLTDFKTVTTSAARYQNLSLNPAKLAGQCGKLKCCLNYELDTYLDALRNFPSPQVKLETEKGTATHCKTDIFKRLIWYTYMPQKAEDEANTEAEVGDSTNWISISVQRANEIIELNKQNIKPQDLKSAAEEEEEVLELPDYENVVGQDSIHRMDYLQGKKKKKKKKKKHGAGPQQPGQQQAGQQQKQTQPQQRQAQPSAQKPQQQKQHLPGPRQQQQKQGQQNAPKQQQQKPASAPPPQQVKPREDTQQNRPRQSPSQPPQGNEGNANSGDQKRPPRQSPQGK